MKGKRVEGGPNELPYKMAVQKQGITIPKAQHPVPMTANPVTKSNPGLGATTISHPFKAGKPKI